MKRQKTIDNQPVNVTEDTSGALEISRCEAVGQEPTPLGSLALSLVGNAGCGAAGPLKNEPKPRDLAVIVGEIRERAERLETFHPEVGYGAEILALVEEFEKAHVDWMFTTSLGQGRKR